MVNVKFEGDGLDCYLEISSFLADSLIIQIIEERQLQRQTLEENNCPKEQPKRRVIEPFYSEISSTPGKNEKP